MKNLCEEVLNGSKDLIEAGVEAIIAMEKLSGKEDTIKYGCRTIGNIWRLMLLDYKNKVSIRNIEKLMREVDRIEKNN